MSHTVYEGSGSRPLQYASTILACLAVVVTIPIYIFYWKGPIIREKSKFAQVLASDHKAGVGGGSIAQAIDGGDSDKTEVEKERQDEGEVERKELV